MENASKALIIAGAILLSILIISLGIMIYNQASGVVDNDAMDEVAVSSFNQKFTQYEGNSVRGANVNALLQTIVQNNLANKGDTSKQIAIDIQASNWGTGTKPTGDSDTSRVTVMPAKALTGKSYKVTTKADEKSGYITAVKIEDAT